MAYETYYIKLLYIYMGTMTDISRLHAWNIERVNGCMFLRISMTIFWKIDVSMEGVVKPSLELLLKMPDQGKINWVMIEK